MLRLACGTRKARVIKRRALIGGRRAKRSFSTATVFRVFTGREGWVLCADHLSQTPPLIVSGTSIRTAAMHHAAQRRPAPFARTEPHTSTTGMMIREPRDWQSGSDNVAAIATTSRGRDAKLVDSCRVANGEKFPPFRARCVDSRDRVLEEIPSELAKLCSIWEYALSPIERDTRRFR